MISRAGRLWSSRHCTVPEIVRLPLKTGTTTDTVGLLVTNDYDLFRTESYFNAPLSISVAQQERNAFGDKIELFPLFLFVSFGQRILERRIFI
jgi:hypothetical protein